MSGSAIEQPDQGAGTGSHGRKRSASSSQAVRLVVAVIVVVAAAAVAWPLVHHGAHQATTPGPAKALTGDQVAALPSTVAQPVYWAGARPGYTYELTRANDGRTFIRYLPRGVAVGDPRNDFLSIGTYPVHDPVAAVRALAMRVGSPVLELGGGGVATQDRAHPTSYYLAYPSTGYQVEVFAPSAATVRQLVVAGRIVPIGGAAGSSQSSAAPAKAVTPKIGTPQATTAAALRRLAAHAGHPVYWAGPRAGTRFERTQTAAGRIYIRYLPPHAAIGAHNPYFTVATYPVASPAAAVKAIAARQHSRTFAVAGGGLGVVDSAHPTSVYVAFSGNKVEVEVFAPSPALARQAAASGRIKPIR